MSNKRISQVELCYKANSVKTFNRHIYEIKGLHAIDKQNGDIKSVCDVYYQVRTALSKQKGVIAKRKNKDEELFLVR